MLLTVWKFPVATNAMNRLPVSKAPSRKAEIRL
jgi:hypothetical protein